MQNSYNKCSRQMPPMALGSMRLPYSDDIGYPLSPSPINYTSCAGNYCVTCETVWDENNKRWVRKCVHWIKTITGEEGQWL